MLLCAMLFIVGLFLSAFFSGSETGFYRVARVRLLLDGLDGDPVSRLLLWLTNNPTLFVATTLVGNNLANYLTSLSVVMALQYSSFESNVLVELVTPVLLAPVVFVYGELMPKSVYFLAPNRLLRRGGWLFLTFAVLFSPIAAVLWGFGRFLQQLVGSTPLRIRLTLARRELQQLFQEGQEVGLLRPAQRALAQNLFAVASQPVTQFCRPVGRMASLRLGAAKSELLRVARRHGVAFLPILARQGRELAGYVRVIDLRLGDGETVEHVRKLLVLSHRDSHINALIRLRTADEDLAEVVDEDGKTVGLLYQIDLLEPLFRHDS